jgi:hypothetical protein
MWRSLLPPYAPLDEVRWKEYYDERSKLDASHMPDNPKACKDLRPENLMQDSFKALWTARTHVADAIVGAVLDDEERRTEIAETIRGSLYYTEVWGNDECVLILFENAVMFFDE